MTKTYRCKGCDDVREFCTEPEFKEPINGRCADCWDDFTNQDLEDQFEELMEL